MQLCGALAMKALPASIEIRLIGDNIQPGAVSSRELADIIASVEEMVAAVVVQKHPDVPTNEVIVGLVSVGAGSVRLEFASPLSDLMDVAYSEIAETVVSQDYTKLPSDTVKGLRTISGIARRRNCSIEMRASNGRSRVLAVIEPSTLVDIPDVQKYSGPTTLHAKVIRVGGKTPTVMVELPDGNTLYVKVKQGVAIEMAQWLYHWVMLTGEARWNYDERAIDDFEVERFAPFDDVPIDEAMAGLAALVGSVFDDVDAEEYVADLRHGDEREGHR